jgi:hypothetical protein
MKLFAAVDQVRRYPEMYWSGNAHPGVADVNAGLLTQLADDGFGDAETAIFNQWNVVCCKLDWANRLTDRFGSFQHVFENAVAVPGPSAGGLRVEWLVSVLAQEMHVWVDGRLMFSKGRPSCELDDLPASCAQGCVCIAYRLVDRT